MKKNPGRRDHRRLTKQNRSELSEKKMAINERRMLWLSNWIRFHKKCKNFNKIFPEYAD